MRYWGYLYLKRKCRKRIFILAGGRKITKYVQNIHKQILAGGRIVLK